MPIPASNLGMENVLRDVHDPVSQSLRTSIGVGGATAANQALEIAELSNIDLNTLATSNEVAASNTLLTNIDASTTSIDANLLILKDKTAAGFVPERFDETAITYVGITTQIATVTYKLATATVATLTMTYDGSNRLIDVVRT